MNTDSDSIAVRATPDETPVIRALYKRYLEDMKVYVDTSRSLRFFDLYWRKPQRCRVLIRDRGDPVGFALLDNQPAGTLPTDYVVAEYYVQPGSRRAGLGLRAAHQIFRTCPGRWEVAVLRSNLPAQQFWTQVLRHPMIQDYTAPQDARSVQHWFRIAEVAP